MVAIVTDSAANIPAATAAEAGIVIVPLFLRFGDEVFRDGTELTPKDFYRRLVEDEVPVSTASPSPGDFLEAFEASGHHEIVCVTVAQTMSSSYNDARLAAERFGGRVEVVDSANASLAQGFVALEAARCAATRAPLDAVAARAWDVALRAGLIAMVDTFEFLRRSGRVTKLQAYAATMLDIKPVFRFWMGEAAPVARPRTRRRALARVVEETVAAAAGRPLHLGVIHAQAEDDANGVADRIAADALVVERLVVEVTPVIGAHTGPGLVGAAFYTD